ncbi:MAG: PrgI family protein [Firmicutes bacterium]|nr:PrgI family protein [Bacillota bacterium]
MEVKMNKEIRDYQESMFMGLNFRQCVFSLLAIFAAIGIYFGLKEFVGDEIIGWFCVLGAVPFAACGFFRYHGMNAEQFLWAYIKSEFLYPKMLLFRTEDIYYSCMKETIRLGDKGMTDGAALRKKQEVRKKKSVKKKGRGEVFD